MVAASVKITAEMARALAERETARRTRSVELARLHHLDGTSWVDLPDAHGVERFRVPSADRRREYIVAHHYPSDSWWCSCAAGVHGRACGHLGAALHHRNQRQRMLDAEGVSLPAYFAEQHAVRAWLAAHTSLQAQHDLASPLQYR